MKLSGLQVEQLANALLDAYRTPDRLTQMVRVRLDKNLYALAMGGSLKDIVYRLIDLAEQEGWVEQLIVAARASNPNNLMLLELAQSLGLAPAPPPEHENLERLIRHTNSYLDITQWRTRLGEIEGQVCRIEVATNEGQCYGTGFLVGPETLLTNYHVMEPVIAGAQGRSTAKGESAQPEDVILRFDYKESSDGKVIHKGTLFRLATPNWLIDASPNSSGEQLPRADELDYALLRVANSPGTKPVGGSSEGNPAQRRWIVVPSQPYRFAPSSPLFIVEHPEGEPLKLALDTDAIAELNKNQTRVLYKTNTEKGSSGSPCFNQNWDLVALHHSSKRQGNATYNEGIPMHLIHQLLKERGHLDKLGAGDGQASEQTSLEGLSGPPVTPAATPSQPIGFTAIKIAELEKLKEGLIKQFQAASQQRNYVLSEVDKLRLTEQMRHLEEQILEAEQELASLRR